MSEENQKPFSKDYVVHTTVKHMRKSIDISIRKTFERVAEFDSNSTKSREVFETLSILHTMRSQLDYIQAATSDLKAAT